MTRLGRETASGLLALIGTGAMAQYYAAALASLGYPPNALLVVGRAEERARAIAERYGAAWCKLEALAHFAPVRAAIIAVTQNALPEITEQVSEIGANRILIEKPGALSSTRLQAVGRHLARRGVAAAVAFNRRFYESVRFARSMIAADGGLVSCLFEISEIERLVIAERGVKQLPDEVLERWGVANSTHVIDLAFHLAGFPVDLQALRTGALPWHPAGAAFAGTGLTRDGTILTYVGNWSGAGRWRIEAVTRRRRMVLCPLEKVHQQMKDSFDLVAVDLPPEPSDTKPGVCAMLEEFLGVSDTRYLASLDETIDTLRHAETIFGYQ